MRVELEPGKPSLMVMRTVTGIAQHFEVRANGEPIATVKLAGGRARNWLEFNVGEISAEDRGSLVEIETLPIHYGGDLRPIVSFHYWFLQP